MDTQTQIERLIDLAIIQRSELKKLVSELPQLREHLNAEIERVFEDAEPQLRTELEDWTTKQAKDQTAKLGGELEAKIAALSKSLEATTQTRYNAIMAERAQNIDLAKKAEDKLAEVAQAIPVQVKQIVTDELARFPRAGEIDQLRKEFAEPRGLNPRGRWQVGETYNKLDLVSYNGDSYVSNIDGNSEKPSRSSAAWTLSAARGNGGAGGGVTSMTDLVPVPANGELLIGNGSAFVNATLTAGTGISISNGPGSITINATDGNITLDDGTAAAPSLNFTNEPTTGLFRASANVMGFAVAGVSRATMTTSGVTVTGTITPSGSLHAAAGSVGNPSIAFNADQNTGLYNIGADNIGAAIGGVKVLDVASTGLTVTGALGATSLTAPAATNLTLAGGSTGASLVLGQGANGNATITPSGTGKILSGTTGSEGGVGLSAFSVGTATGLGGTAYRVSSFYSTAAAAADRPGVILGFDTAGAGVIAAATQATGQPLAFWTYNGSAWGEKMRIATTGNLLIGTTTDGGQKLQVAGTGYFSGDFSSAGTITSIGANDGYFIATRSTASRYALFTYRTGVADDWVIGLRGSGEGFSDDLTYRNGSGAVVSRLSKAGAATFAGAVAINNTVATAVAVASTHKVTMVIGGVTYYLLASNV